MTSEDGDEKFNLTFSAVQVITSPSDHYIDADWETILRAPLFIFEAIASANRTVDERERAALRTTLDRPPPGVFAAFVFSHVRRHFDAVAAARANDMRTPFAALADVETLLRSYPNQNEAEEFRRALLILAETVAQAAGGGLFGRGARLSDAEAAILAQLRTLFHVEAR